MSFSGPSEPRPLLKSVERGLSIERLRELRLIAQEREDHYTRMLRDAERKVRARWDREREQVRCRDLRRRLDAWVERIAELERRIAAEEDP